MTKLEELIKELCPNGVENKKFENLLICKRLITITPTVKIKRNDYKSVGTTPIVSQEEEHISGYCDFFDKNIPDGEYICFGDHSEHIKYVNFSFVQGADGLKIIKAKDSKISLKYIYYALCNNYKRHLYLTVLEHPYLYRVEGSPRFCLSGCCCSTVLVNVNGKKSSLKIIMKEVRQKCLAFLFCLKCNDFLVALRERKQVVYIYSVIATLASLCPNSATLPLCRKANKILEDKKK